MKKIRMEIDCRRCEYCSKDECQKYGAATDVAAKFCKEEAYSNFTRKAARNSTRRDTKETRK